MFEARPTNYKGIQMRSRLEALYAQRLDTSPQIGLSGWQYEPRCFASAEGQYLPDFRLEFTDGRVTYVEVKPPTADPEEALSRMHVILASEPGVDLMVVVSDGGYPEPKWSFSWCDPALPCCDRRADQPLLAWRRGVGSAAEVVNSSAQYSRSLEWSMGLEMVCAFCRWPGPRIEDASAVPFAHDPLGPKVRAVVQMHCDHCSSRWWLTITSVLRRGDDDADGPRVARLHVQPDPRDREQP